MRGKGTGIQLLYKAILTEEVIISVTPVDVIVDGQEVEADAALVFLPGTYEFVSEKSRNKFVCRVGDDIAFLVE